MTTSLSSVAIIGLVLTGCSQMPDPRSADVVVRDTALLPATRSALTWWNEATQGDTADATLASECSHQGRSCITVQRGTLTDSDDGLTDVHADDARRDITIRIDPSVSGRGPETAVIAHELGHAFEMPDVHDPSDLMTAWNFTAQPCIGPATLHNWQTEYGVSGVTVCRSLTEEH